MKLIAVGSTATVVALVLAGPATARPFSPSLTQTKHGASALSDSASVPGGGTVSLAGGNYPKGTQVAPTVGRSHVGSGTTSSASGDSFSWSDAGAGAGVGIGVIGLLGVGSIAIRRGKARPVAA